LNLSQVHKIFSGIITSTKLEKKHKGTHNKYVLKDLVRLAREWFPGIENPGWVE